MAATLMKTSPQLINFFIYNSSLGPKEGMEKEKILMYLPFEEDIEKKIKNIGLCEALVKFTKQFSPCKPCESVHTQKTRQVFYEPEPEYWMIMTISIPFSEKATTANAELQHNESDKHYHNEDIHDTVLRAILKQTYNMFKLFNGSFNHILSICDLSELRRRLDYFYKRYLSTLNFAQIDILDVFSGIYFLSLDKNTFLKVCCFMNSIKLKFSAVKYTIFLFEDQMVWSGLEHDDMRIVYKYLTTSLLPTANEEWQTFLRQSATQSDPQLRAQQGRFLTCPRDLMDEIPGPQRKLPRVFIQNEHGVLREFFLVVYQFQGATVSLLVEVDSSFDKEYCKQLSTYISPRINNLSNVVNEQNKKKITADPDYRYVYFNSMNLAQKTTMHNNGALNVSSEISKIICNINDDFSNTKDDSEVFMKTLTDCWIVARKADQRQLYVVLNEKNANLIDVNDEVKRMASTHFNQMFFFD